MTVQIVYETHSISNDVVVIGHSATRWSLDYQVLYIELEHLVNAAFRWQPGWRYVLDAGYPCSR